MQCLNLDWILIKTDKNNKTQSQINKEIMNID